VVVVVANLATVLPEDLVEVVLIMELVLVELLIKDLLVATV
jgi:hypothetical protein